MDSRVGRGSRLYFELLKNSSMVAFYQFFFYQLCLGSGVLPDDGS